MKAIGTKTLETERLILRKYKISDALGMYENWGTDSNCNTYLPWSLHKNIEETKELITNWINSYDNEKFKWIIELRDTHEVIGGIDVVKLKKDHDYCEVGYCIGSKFWGNGYATEALKRVISFLFEEVEINLIEAEHHKTNVASGKVMEKSGMIKEAILRSRRLNNKTKEIEDLIIYSITKEEFNNNKKNS